MKRLLLISTIVLFVALLYFFIDARFVNFFPRCPFYALTGFFCPGCGSQRALSSLLHGDFLQAINYNVLMVICLPFLLYSASIAAANAFRIQKIKQRIFYSPFFVKTLLVIVIAFFILRNIPSYPFNLLAPGKL